ncbi:MAG: hypothetical protein EBT79_06480 [Actinobacteria bacterium]|nr:hypothetical protein [Actinomycetota bacterium]
MSDMLPVTPTTTAVDPMTHCRSCGFMHSVNGPCPAPEPRTFEPMSLEARVLLIEARLGMSPTPVVPPVEPARTPTDGEAERQAVVRYLTWFAEEYDVVVLHRAIAHIQGGRHVPRPV